MRQQTDYNKTQSEANSRMENQNVDMTSVGIL